MIKLLPFLLFLPFILLAQENESFLIKAKIKQGSILLGGTVNASAYKITDELSAPLQKLEGHNINVVARAKNGYFLQHDFALGLDFTINHESVRFTSDPERKPDNKTYMLLGPFARYYLDNGIFGEASAAVGLLNFSLSEKYNLFEGAVGVGYAHFFNEKFSIEPILSFRYFQQVLKNKKYTRYGPMFGVGIQAYLLRKKAHIIKRAL